MKIKLHNFANTVNQRGFSLVEMMIGMAISLLVLAGVMSLFNNQRKVYSLQEQVSEMDQNARSAMNFIVRKVRMMGYDPLGRNGPDDFGLTGSYELTPGVIAPNFSANASVFDYSVLSFTRDIGNSIDADTTNDPDGVLANNANERYYFYIAGNSELMWGNIRSTDGTWDVTGNVLAENIDLLNITYVYADGSTSAGADNVLGTLDDVLPNNTNGVTTDDLSEVKRLIITLRARTAGSDPNYTSPIDGTGRRSVTYSTSVTPRNLDSVL